VSVDTFTPEIWSLKLLSSLKKSLVYAQPSIVNRDYEGEISEKGDTVHINSVGRPTIATYVKGVTTIVPEQLSTAQRSLVIDQSKYFAFEVDDIDKRQNAGNVIPEAMTEAAYGLRDLADMVVASLYVGAQAANVIAGPIVILGTAAEAIKAYELVLVPLKILLDNANVPTEGRYAVVPPWFHGRLLLDSRFVKVNESGTETGLRNGQVGRAAGFDILVSNNTPNPAASQAVVQVGVPNAISFAEQINKTEAYRPQDSFSDAVKGLHLYGTKLIRPDSIAYAVTSPV